MERRYLAATVVMAATFALFFSRLRLRIAEQSA